MLINYKKYFTQNNIKVLFFSLFELCYIYVLIRPITSKLIILLFLCPIILFNSAFINYIKNRKVNFINRNKKIKFYILVIFLSLIFCKSININIFSLSQGYLSIPSSIGLITFCYQLILFIIFTLDNIGFVSNKNTNNKYSIFLYAIPSIIICTFLYLVYFPGVRSIDSLVIWTDVGRSMYNDAHPIVYMFLVKLLRLIWDDIAVITLFNMLLTILTFAFIAKELEILDFPKCICWIVAIVLPIVPANALYSVTMWKDIPYTMGLLILCILLLRCFTSDYYYSKRALPQLFFVSLFTLFMRHNALLSVLFSLFIVGVYYLVKKNKKLIFKTLILGIALVVSYFGIKNISIIALSSESSGGNFSGQSLVHYSVPPTIAEQQIIFTEHVAGTSFTPEEREAFEVIFNVEGLNAHKEKYKENDIWMYYHKPGETTYHKCPSEYFWKYYFKMWTRFPKSMAMGYQKITSIIWSSSSYGSVAYRGTTDNVELEGLETYEFRPVIKKFMDMRLYKTVFNYKDSSLSTVFWRPAFPFVLALILLAVAFRKHGKAAIFMFLPVFLNQITYLIVIASQDTRYTYVNYTMFIVMLSLALLKPKSKTKESDKL